MVAPVLRVNLGELSHAATRLSSVADRLGSEVVVVDGVVTGLVGGGAWSGKASASYADVWGLWHEGAGSVVEGLSGLADALGTMARAFAET